MMWKRAKWLGIPREELREKEIYHGDLGGRFAYFRCDKELPTGCSLTLDITAIPVTDSGSTGKACSPAPARGIAIASITRPWT